MSKRKILVVIESSNKKPIFYKIAKDNHPTDEIDVFVTKGRLLDIPDTHNAISVLNNRINIQWKPIHPELINDLKAKISQNDEIYLCTDNDDEGHMIAWQISQLTHNKPTYRLIVNELTEHAFMMAENSKYKPEHKQAEPALRRRVFDKIIGQAHLYVSDRSIAPISRIKSPVAQILLNEDYTSQLVTIKATNDIEITFEIAKNKEYLLSPILIDLEHKIDAGASLIACDVLVPIRKHEFATYTETLKEAANEHNIPVIEAHKAAQDLYENGDISYPRTLNTVVYRSTAKNIQQLANNTGKRFNLAKSHLANKSYNINHEAIHALTPPNSVQRTANAHKLHKLIFNNTINTNPYTYYSTESVREFVAHNDALLNRLLDISTVFNARKIISRLNKSIGWSSKITQIESKKKRNDLIILSALESSKLDKASTIALHSHKLASSLLRRDGTPSLQAEAVKLLTANIAPALASPNIVREINNIFQDVTINTNTAITEALKHSGYIPNDEFSRIRANENEKELLCNEQLSL